MTADEDPRQVVLDEAIGLLQQVAHRQQGSAEQVQAIGGFLEAAVFELMALRRGEPFADPPGPDPDRACVHPDFEAGVTVQRIVGDGFTAVGFWAEVMVACTACDEAFRWTGPQVGLSPAEPRTSVDQRTLHAPFRPASADEDFGLGLPGFDVNLIGPEVPHAMTAAAVRRQALLDAAELVRGRIAPTTPVTGKRVLRQAVQLIEQAAGKEAGS